MKKKLNHATVAVVWELARDAVGTERAYSEAPCGERKARLSKEINSITNTVAAMGEEAMRLFVTCREILRDRKDGV